MKIADREIGPGHSIFIQVETGVTHVGDLKRAFALIEAAADSGADACKFIVTDPDKIMSRKDVQFTYQTVVGSATRPIYDLLKETQFTFEQWREIRDYCHQHGLIFYATADHLDAVDLLEALSVPAHKSSAWDLGYARLLQKMADTGKSTVVELGTAHPAEMLEVARIFGEARTPMMWMHAPHPTIQGDWNFSRLERYATSMGFSSPNRESWCDFLALGLGAAILEKRLTLRRDDPDGHHHSISLEPDEFRDWVKQIRQAETALREPPFGGSDMAWAERRKWGRDPMTGLRP